MSFVRLGRSQHTQGKRPVRPKKAAAPRREWVSTVNDLSVHKLTPDELNHRHEIHKSHNKAVAQWELKEKALKRRLRQPGSPAPLDHATLSIIREVFSDQLLLQDVLARSDRAMAVVKDLFGDAPRRQTGHPSVTMAPNCESDSALPVLQRPDPPTQLSLLSQSMMDQQALNELEVSEEEHSDGDTCPAASSKSHVIHRANLRKMKLKNQSRVVRQQRVCPNFELQAEGGGVPVTPCTSATAPDPAALNATVAVQHLRSRQSQSEEGKDPSTLVTQVLNPESTLNQSGRNSGCSSRSRKTRAECFSQSSGLDGSAVSAAGGEQSSLGLLQAMLGQVEAELDSLSPDTVPTSIPGQQQHKTAGLTGFSVALVSTLQRLVHLVRQREEEAQKEAEERRRLEGEVREQRTLIDALTADVMALREESAALQAGLQQHTEKLDQKLDTVVVALGGLGLLGAHTDCGPQDSNVKVCQTGPFPERTQAPVSPAVLLSPPQQRDTWQHRPVGHPVRLHHDPPPLATTCSYEDVQACVLSNSLSSLPLTSFPSTSSLTLTSDPLPPQRSQEAMLAEITQLTRQNELIRTQLNQAKTLGSEVRRSPNDSSEQRASCSSSAGRATPPSAGERRLSNSTGRANQNSQAVTGERLTQQAAMPDSLSASTVEQRLLELNRQSAAARSRLLGLIEQQRQSSSARVSPSISPIPPSAVSPHTAGGEGTPEVSMLLPVQDPLSQASGGGRRSAGGEVLSQSPGGETRDGKTQVHTHKPADKLREREGWFALSAHVR
ncbi:spindle and centriole-associated protein 1 isoform X2 [Myripristis murdjan]|nr:spindle and centriole-associated protein 1 isoform X2 [Myripristis murdjan]XP_029935473.1 spindle and centriole-associated protein 1 isoform X2 [Myripristis murdjan]